MGIGVGVSSLEYHGCSYGVTVHRVFTTLWVTAILWPMARPPKDTQAAQELADRLNQLKEQRERKAGHLAYDQISREIFAADHYVVSGEQVRKYHTGEVDPRTVHLEEIAALALFYEVPLERLSPIAFERGNKASDLLTRAFGWLSLFDLAAA